MRDDDISARPQPASRRPPRGGPAHALGLGLISGAADDDPSAIGTYASAGARFGPAFLWVAPAMLPMMYVVVYLCSKLGQVSGRGLFRVLHDSCPRWLLYPVLAGVLVGNTIEAGADLGGVGAALGMFVAAPIPLIVAVAGAGLYSLQVFGSYRLIRNVFRWLSLALLAYVGSGLLARPDLGAVLRATFAPHVELSRDFLGLLEAALGASLSAYLFSWQSNVEVEEEIAAGHTRLAQRQGATRAELSRTRKDVLAGMVAADLVLYFVVLATASTLYPAGHRNVRSAAAAAQALTPLAGPAAALLFAAGIAGVGCLAVPVMTAGAAYDLLQTFGVKGTLNARARDAKLFYATIAAFTAAAVGFNFLGLNPMKALVLAGVVQGFSTPVLLALIVSMTSSRNIMGARVNGLGTRLLGWATTALATAASVALVVSWAIG